MDSFVEFARNVLIDTKEHMETSANGNGNLNSPLHPTVHIR